MKRVVFHSLFTIVIIAGKTPSDMGCLPHKDKPATVGLKARHVIAWGEAPGTATASMTFSGLKRPAHGPGHGPGQAVVWFVFLA